MQPRRQAADPPRSRARLPLSGWWRLGRRSLPDDDGNVVVVIVVGIAAAASRFDQAADVPPALLLAPLLRGAPKRDALGGASELGVLLLRVAEVVLLALQPRLGVWARILTFFVRDDKGAPPARTRRAGRNERDEPIRRVVVVVVAGASRQRTASRRSALRVRNPSYAGARERLVLALVAVATAQLLLERTVGHASQSLHFGEVPLGVTTGPRIKPHSAGNYELHGMQPPA